MAAIQSKVRLSVGVDEARQAILDALPKDAIVREEDDGVGRFAGQRTLVILGRSADRMLLFHGTYGAVKRHFEDPHLDVVFDTSKSRVVAKLIRQAPASPSAVARFFDVAGYIGAVAAVLFAYYSIRSIPFDNQRIALVAGIGGIAWALVANALPKSDDETLFKMVDEALKPFAVAKKKKKKAESASDASDDPAADADAEAEAPEPEAESPKDD